MTPLRRQLVAFTFLLASSCATEEGVFPGVVTSLSESSAELPNPVSLAVDEANSQIVVANSNVDIFFEGGSLTVLAVDASTPADPSLAARQVLAAPNFAGEMSFDAATGSLYVPYRASSASDETLDRLAQYTVSASGLAEVRSAAISPNPFGTALDSSRLYVVSDDSLGIFDLSLNAAATVDLTAAGAAGLEDSPSADVEYVAVDPATNLAAVSNPNGRLFIVNMATGTISAVVDGPDATRNLIVNDSLLYALDPILEEVWVFDLTLFAAPSSTPGSVDDSTFLAATIPVGGNPNGMAFDPATSRLYVGNSLDNTVSVLDTVSLAEVARIGVDAEDLGSFSRDGDYPFALELGEFNGVNYLFITGFDANSVVMIHTGTLQVVEVYPDRV